MKVICSECGKIFEDKDEIEVEKAFDAHPCLTNLMNLTKEELIAKLKLKRIRR